MGLKWIQANRATPYSSLFYLRIIPVCSQSTKFTWFGLYSHTGKIIHFKECRFNGSNNLPGVGFNKYEILLLRSLTTSTFKILKFYPFSHLKLQSVCNQFLIPNSYLTFCYLGYREAELVTGFLENWLYNPKPDSSLVSGSIYIQILVCLVCTSNYNLNVILLILSTYSHNPVNNFSWG